jgi:hypothetical protein
MIKKLIYTLHTLNVYHKPNLLYTFQRNRINIKNTMDIVSSIIDKMQTCTLSSIDPVKSLEPIKLIPQGQWVAWSEKSKDVDFKSSSKCIGNGEHKLAKELDIETKPGGQNSTVDLHHKDIGPISVKDMTSDDCTLGTEGSQRMTRVFIKVLYPLINWCEKYSSQCIHAKDVLDKLSYNSTTSKMTLIQGIERREISGSNFVKINEIIEHVKKIKKDVVPNEYITDICDYMKNDTFQDKMNECVREEALVMTLIIVHKTKGWMIVKDVSKLSCPRITRGSVRIHLNT